MGRSRHTTPAEQIVFLEKRVETLEAEKEDWMDYAKGAREEIQHLESRLLQIRALTSISED